MLVQKHARQECNTNGHKAIGCKTKEVNAYQKSTGMKNAG